MRSALAIWLVNVCFQHSSNWDYNPDYWTAEEKNTHLSHNCGTTLAPGPWVRTAPDQGWWRWWQKFSLRGRRCQHRRQASPILMADHDWTKMMMTNTGLDACSWRGQVLTTTTMMMVMMSAMMMMLMTMTAASRMAAHEKADWSVAADLWDWLHHSLRGSRQLSVVLSSEPCLNMVDEKAKAQPELDYSFSPVCRFSPDGRVTEGVRQVSWRGYSLFWV